MLKASTNTPISKKKKKRARKALIDIPFVMALKLYSLFVLGLGMFDRSSKHTQKSEPIALSYLIVFDNTVARMIIRPGSR